MIDGEGERPETVQRVTLDNDTMWENLCIADELSEDCIALASGMTALSDLHRSREKP